MPNFVTKLATPTLTFTLLEEKHMGPVVKNLLNGKFQLYMLGGITSLESDEFIPVDGNPNLLVLEPRFTPHPSAATEVSEGALMISSNTGEVAVLDLAWLFGVDDVEGFELFEALPSAQKKRLIPHQMLLNAIP